MRGFASIERASRSTSPTNPASTTRLCGGSSSLLLDVSRQTDLGWKPEMELEDGIRPTFEWYMANAETARR